METNAADIWIAACAHRLQKHWRSVDPADLEEAARLLRRDQRLGAMSPDEAAAEWLKPVASAHVHPIHQCNGS